MKEEKERTAVFAGERRKAMNSFTPRDIGLFNSLGEASEIEGNAWLIKKEGLRLYVVMLDGSYEASVIDKGRSLQARASRPSLENAVSTALYRYKKKLGRIGCVSEEAEAMGLALWRNRNENKAEIDR